jgi:hypothetical protein
VFRFTVLVPGEAHLLVRAPQPIPVPPGIRVVDIEAVAEAVEPPPAIVSPEPAPQPVPQRPAVGPTLEGPSRGATAETGTGPRSLTDRILPRGTDPRLFIPILPPADRPLTADEQVQARVTDRLAAWNDSLEAEAAAAGRALDWTRTDADGNQWGLTPGKIHLGGVTLPLPFGFGPPPSVRADMRDRVEGWEAIQRQAAQGKGRDELRDRIKAIREMRDARRDTTKRK